MKNCAAIILSAFILYFAPRAEAATKSAAIGRNLDWAGSTLDKIEKDLAEVTREQRLTNSASLNTAFEIARGRLAALKTAAGSPEPDSDIANQAVDFTRNVGSLAQSILDHINDQEQKHAAFHKVLEDNPPLEKTDLGKRFGENLRALAGDLVRMAAFQLEDKQSEAALAEGAWSLDALRCDQVTEEATDEATYLSQREELADNMREAGKTVSLAPLDAARDKVRAAKQVQKDLAIERQKLANQIAVATVQTQVLDLKAGKLGDAADLARQAYDEAHDGIQQAIDEN